MMKRTRIIALFLCTAGAVARGEVVPIATSQPVRRTAEAVLASQLGRFRAAAAITAADPNAAPGVQRFSVIDGASRSYGTVTATVYHTASEAHSWALLDSIKPANATGLAMGKTAWDDGTRLGCSAGPYALLLAGGTAADRGNLAKAILARIGVPRADAPLVGKLPAEGRIADSERYAPSVEVLQREFPAIREDVFQLEAGGAEVALARYAQPVGAPFVLFLAEYETPQLAADAERRLAGYQQELPAAERASTLFRREGNYMLLATGVTDEGSARRTLEAVDYAYTVKWLKDPYAVPARDLVDEARKTALVILNSFLFVAICFAGAIVCGLLVGASLFRRRRKASAAVFSDAAGMIQLDLGSRQMPPATRPLMTAGEDCGLP